MAISRSAEASAIASVAVVPPDCRTVTEWASAAISSMRCEMKRTAGSRRTFQLEEAEQRVAAFHIQGRGRLIEDQQSPRPRYRAGQRTALPAVQRQHADRRVQLDRLGAQRVKGFARHASLLGLRAAPAEHAISAQENIVEHGHFRRDQRLLEDSDDPARLRLARGAHGERRARKLDQTRVGTHDATSKS